MSLKDHAKMLLSEFSDYREDAQRAAGNCAVGSAMSITTGAPRQMIEAAIAEALAELEAEVE